MKYTFEIVETLKRRVTVEAEDLVEAERKVHSAYGNEEIVLDSSDFDGFEIYEVGGRQ